MKQCISITELDVVRSHLSFFLPFGYYNREMKHIARTLEQNGFSYFNMKNMSRAHSLYGNDIVVEGKELEQYFLPYIEHKLFPESLEDNGFHRFSKAIGERFDFKLRDVVRSFILRSLDVILGPFGIAFITIRTELCDDSGTLTDVLDFMNHFRSIESKLEENKGAKILHPENGTPLSVHDFLFDRLWPFLKDYILHDGKRSGYFGSLPYFEDERMYASGFLFTRHGTVITDDQLFRMGNLNGRSPDGKPFISAKNPDYIRRVFKHTLHDRWAPDSYTVTTDHAYMNITNQPPEEMAMALSQYMGTHYYNFILHYFYKIMLLRVSFEYSELDWKKDEEYVKSLTKLISLFSSWYYFGEISTRSEGKELSQIFYRTFAIENLFSEVNNTLHELYKSQERSNSGRMNMLLFVLTVFTVISGIYGMNLVIEDWEKPFDWHGLTSYTFFEWISLITAISGISLSAYLIFSTFGKMVWRKWRMRKNKFHM